MVPRTHYEDAPWHCAAQPFVHVAGRNVEEYQMQEKTSGETLEDGSRQSREHNRHGLLKFNRNRFSLTGSLRLTAQVSRGEVPSTAYWREQGRSVLNYQQDGLQDAATTLRTVKIADATATAQTQANMVSDL